jgi:hypothetical protein
VSLFDRFQYSLCCLHTNTRKCASMKKRLRQYIRRHSLHCCQTSCGLGSANRSDCICSNPWGQNRNKRKTTRPVTYFIETWYFNSLYERRQEPGVAQTVWCLTTDWTTGVQSPAGAKDYSSKHSVQTDSEAHPASYPIGTGSPFLGVKRDGA